jgi:putative membrane protein
MQGMTLAASRVVPFPARFLRCAALPLALALLLAGCDKLDSRALALDSLRARADAIARFTDVGAAANVQRDFLTTAAQSSLFEIEASRIALARGGSKAVRRYAESTLRDRVAVDTDLEQLAASVGVVLPSRLSDEFEARLAVLAQLTGGEFDRAYARNVGVLAQEEALAAFERAANVSGVRVQRFAASQLPALREHLAQGRRLAEEVNRTNMAQHGTRPAA